MFDKKLEDNFYFYQANEAEKDLQKKAAELSGEKEQIWEKAKELHAEIENLNMEAEVISNTDIPQETKNRILSFIARKKEQAINDLQDKHDADVNASSILKWVEKQIEVTEATKEDIVNKYLEDIKNNPANYKPIN